ncbi:MAG: hypothetical protein M3040_02665 [Bacteroidota bacterium]|nr:hypothetical protein [Bacteroidota bacterium]
MFLYNEIKIYEQKIRDRTKQLIAANAQLEKINVELEQFTHVSSHDLQEPLRKIRLYSNMVVNQSSQDLDVATKKHISKIKESAGRMSNTLTALLDYIELKNVAVFSEVDLNTLIAGVLTDLEVVIAEKGGQVILDKLPVIQAIPHQIQQFIFNIINNAVKFSKAAVPPQISIKADQIYSTDTNPDIDKNKP